MTRRVVTAGLAPSPALAPSPTLAPASTIYAGGPITPNQIWITTGTNGSLQNLSAWIEFGEGITYTYGRSSMFEDVSPGTFTFTLNNSDGRFTPENPSSPLGTKLTEGSQVLWVLGTRIVHGYILTLEIPADEATWDHLVVTCDDMIGVAGRHSITSIADALAAATNMDLMWLLDEEDGQTSGKEQHGDGLGPFNLTRSNPTSTTDAVTFGVDQVPGLPGTAVTLTAAPGETNTFGTPHGNTTLISGLHSAALPAGSLNQNVYLGTWNLWVYPQATVDFVFVPKFGTDNPGNRWAATIHCTPTGYSLQLGAATVATYLMSAAEQLLPHFLAMRYDLVWQTSGSYWALFGHLYVDGVDHGYGAWSDPQHGYRIPQYVDSMSPVEIALAVTNPVSATGNVSATVQRISHTGSIAAEQRALSATLDSRRATLDFVAPELNSATYNGPLSPAPIGFPDVSGSTILDIYNDIIRSEAGHMFALTVGQIGGSVTYIEMRARDRPTTPKVVFDVSTEGSGLPSFVRDITNVAASIAVAGPTDTVTVTDPTVTGRYVTVNAGETVLYANDSDLRDWGQDRLYRGKNRAVRAQTFTVDAYSTPTDRSADLLSLVPGDRVQLKSLPVGRLGFGTWDGWVVGGSESHTPTSNLFTLNFTPATPAPAVADTDLFAAGGDVIIGGSYTATATSIVVATYYNLTMSAAVPYTIQIDQEQMTVTAVSGATLTVIRGVNGTTPTPHTSATPLEVVPTAMYAY